MSGEEGSLRLPPWLNNPKSYIYKRITEFIVATVVGFAARLGERILEAWLMVRGWFVDAGTAVSGGFGYVGGGVVGTVVGFANTATGITEAAGPLGWVVWIIIFAAIGALLYRLGRAILNAIPFAGPSIDTLLFRAVSIGAIGLVARAGLELVGGGPVA